MGEAHTLLASDAKIPSGARREHWQQALAWYQKSIPGLTASTSGSFQEIAESTLKQANSGVARCEQELSRLSESRR
jgi:hypothetical protein